MKKLNPKESLERVLLMMNYTPAKTLSENKESVNDKYKSYITEAVPGGSLQNTGREAANVGKEARDLARGGKSGAAVKREIKSIEDELSSAVAKGELTQAKKDDIGERLLDAETRNFAGKKKKDGTLPNESEIDAFAATKKEEIKSKFPEKPEGQVTTTVTHEPGMEVLTRKPRKPSTRIKKEVVTPEQIGMIAKLKKSFSRANWKSIFKYTALVGGLGAVVWYVFLRDVVNVSPCLLDSLTEEEVGQLNGGTSGTITRTQVGNRIADINGGLVFQLDQNGVTTGNGKYKGTYSCDGNNIKVEIAGAVFTIGGGSSTDKGTGNTNNGGGGQSKYKQCSETLPIAMYCKNSTISRVQGCLSIKQDGAFGPLTSEALVAKGLDGQSITQTSIDKACGGQVVKQSAPGTDAEEDDAGGGNSIATTSKGPAADDADEA